VIDSIGAIIGERTSRDLIRTGAKSARVSAVFRDLPALPWFEQMDIFPDENGELLVERTIQPDGKNSCRVNGRPILVTQLRELGVQLLNIHGQHDGQQLLDEECHLSYLDSFGGTAPELERFRALYGKLQSIRDALRALQMDESEKARKIDTLQFQINELERAELQAGEEEELTARRDILRNAERITGAISGAWQALTGGDDGEGAVSLLMTAQESLESGGRYSEELAKLSQQASELRYALDDLAEQVRDMEASLDFYPGELDELESRLDVIYRLKRKYGDSVDEMLAYLERCRNELDEIQFSEDRVKQLEGEFAQALAEAKKQAQLLSDRRRQASETLSQRIQSELKQLDMPKVQFQVEFSPKNCENGMDATGMDEVRFLMSANVGEALKPIQKIASGGELSRIMLALKNVLAENDLVTTMVFDEVDTGVSGRAAQKVAEKLYQVAHNRQVLCVTHLPQIAAMGDVHFSVAKGETEGRTFTVVERLAREGRKQELARLTSGDHVTAVALDGAEEMLSGAEQWKKNQ
jgi:DNA repair protein RecN (Recombination protein N)